MVLNLKMYGLLQNYQMISNEKLTERENQIAERIAWGASQKEVAFDLGISRSTVDNTLRKIYQKLRIGKINELSAWWFCTHFNISFELSPLKRTVVACSLLCLFVVSELQQTDDQYCRWRSRLRRIEYCRRLKD